MISTMGLSGRALFALATCLTPACAWAASVDAVPDVSTTDGSPAPYIALPPAHASLASANSLTRFDCLTLPAGCRADFDPPLTPSTWDLAALPSAKSYALTPVHEATAVPALELDRQLATDGASSIMDPAPTSLAGPIDAPSPRWSDHVPREQSTHRGFWKQAGTVTTETMLFFGYFSLMSGSKLFKETVPFHFHKEGWFGKNTQSVGMDKLTHAFNTYLLSEVLHARIHEKTNGSQGDAVTAAVIASGLMAFNEISDAIEPDSGYSMEDIVMNVAGAGFSVLRNTVPGLTEKVAFKLEIVPNHQIYSRTGKPHYEQMRYMFSIKGAGFEELKKTPLRYLDLQLGYYASDFLNEDRDAGIIPKRHLFVGVGLNVGELFFGRSRSGIGRAANTALDYLQLPYTSLRYDTTGRFGTGAGL